MSATTNPDRARLVERARKLFAMSQDVSSPEEAAIATRRVRSIMDANGITIDEIERASPDLFGTSETGRGTKTMPRWYSMLSLGVARYMDCRVVRTRAAEVRFEGFDVDAVVASLTLDYLAGALDRHCKAYLKEDPTRARFEAGAFRMGYASEMQRRLFALATERRATLAASDGRSLIVRKDRLVAARFGDQKIRNTRCDDRRRGYHAGGEAARRTSLSKQVNGRAATRALN